MTKAPPLYPQAIAEIYGKDASSAACMLGIVQRAMRRAGVDESAVRAFVAEAKSGDHTHMLRTCAAWVTVR